MDGWFSYLKEALPVLTVAGTLAVWVLLARMRQEFPSKSDLKGLVERHERAEDRIAVLEREVAVMRAEISKLPDHDDIADLKVALAGIGASLEGVKTLLSNLQEQTTIITKQRMGITA